MEWQLNPVEIRIIGTLIEKQITTPDYYPLTLNALLAGCNQKSNRLPVLNLEEGQLVSMLANLQLKHLVQKLLLSSSRVSRYRHLFDDVFKPTITEKVILCELFLRGPQTVGELRTRTERMYPISSLTEVEKALEELAARPGGPYVLKLERQPGQKECRYAHLFCGEPDLSQPETAPAVLEVVSDAVVLEAERVAALEEEVGRLSRELRELKERVAKLEN